MKQKEEAGPDILRTAIIESIQEKKGEAVTHIDLTGTGNSVCEFFIITHADSSTQVRAIAKNIEENLKKKHQMLAWHSEGYDNAQWILLDYNSIVVHVFQQEMRDYYRIEQLWADGQVEMINEPGAAEFE